MYFFKVYQKEEFKYKVLSDNLKLVTLNFDKLNQKRDF